MINSIIKNGMKSIGGFADGNSSDPIITEVRKMKKTTLTAAITFAMFIATASLTVQGQHPTWDNSDPDNNLYTNPGNWVDGVLPGDGDRAYISMDGDDRAVIDETSSQSSGDDPWLWIGVDGDGELEITGTDGTFYLSSSTLHLGQNHDGTITQSGGDIFIDSSATIGRGAQDADAKALYDLSGGSLTIDGFFELGDGAGNATFRISNDAELIVESHAWIQRGGGLTGNHRLEVIGSDASITFGDGGHTFEMREPAGDGRTTLYGAVDSGGISTIDVIEGGDVIFRAGSELELDFVDEPVFGTWDFVTWEGDLTDEGLSLADGVNENIWSFDIDEGAKKLTVTAIPEPSSLVLLGLAGLLLMKRRRV